MSTMLHRESTHYFNPRSPCGERRDPVLQPRSAGRISIHAPRAGSDRVISDAHRIKILFQSTLPVRGATCVLLQRSDPRIISIHAPRAGSDLRPKIERNDHGISIHAPRAGSDPPTSARSSGTRKFQSTLPVRGATAKMPKTEPFILSNFHNFKKYTDRTRTKVIIKMELWINLSPFSGANRTGNLWSLLLRTLKGS